MEDAAGEFVDDLDQAVLHHVVHVFLEEDMSLHGLGEVMDELEVALVEDRPLDEVPLEEELLNLVHALGREGDALALLVDLVIALEGFALVLFGILASIRVLLALHELDGEVIHLVDLEGIVLRRAGDDEGRTRLVNEDGVDLVDHAVVVPALNPALGRPGHVVPQVVEAEFIVGAVGDIAGVLAATNLVVHVGEDDSHA